MPNHKILIKNMGPGTLRVRHGCVRRAYGARTVVPLEGLDVPD